MPATTPHAGGRRMRELVVAGDDAADAERRQERRHDAGAEDARAALVAEVPVVGADVADVDLVVAAEELADEQHHDQEEKTERSDRSVDEHVAPRGVPRLGLEASSRADSSRRYPGAGPLSIRHWRPR